jgi:SAM-dependent methyltransferase
MGNQAGFPTLVQQPRRWDVISGMMLELNLKTLVEVGCKEGRTTGHILKTVPDSRVIAIDPWCAMPDQKEVKGGETYEEWDFAKIEATFWENVGENKDRCTMLRMTSEEAAAQWTPEWIEANFLPPAAVDAIFIDAAHDYESVKKDVRLWWPMIREGGILIGHDANHKWPGVERAIADSFDLMRVGFAPDSIWFVLKTGDTDVRGS